MKKFIVLTILAMLMASCSEQHLLDDYVCQTSAQLSEQEPSQTGIVNSYLEKAEHDLQRDLQRGFTTFGPHLDDFDFMFDGKPMRSFGSRGQCRMTSLILKLAELDAVRQVNGALHDTVVLVDDAAADLDLRARRAFLEKIRTAGQIFFAFTEIPPEFKLEKSDLFRVRSGEVEKLN